GELFSQPHIINGYKPRHLTRGKLWVSLRNNGLQGGANSDGATYQDQSSLEYPGNAVREMHDFVEYWIDVAAIVKGGPNILEVPNVTRTNNSRGEGIWVLGVVNGDTLISYTGPRDYTEDVDALNYDIRNGPEAGLGNNDGPNVSRSNYSPDHNTIDQEPVEIHNYRYHNYIPDDEEAEEIIINQWKNKLGIQIIRKVRAWSYQDYDDFILVELIFENVGSNTVEDAFFAFMNAFSVSLAGHTWGSGAGMHWPDWRTNEDPTQDDIYHYTGASNYVADVPDNTSTYQQYKLSYQRDGDWFSTTWDDTGEPYKSQFAARGENELQGQSEDQLLSYAYVGMGAIDYTPPFMKDNNVYVSPQIADQPYAVKWWRNKRSKSEEISEPSRQRHTEREMYTMLSDISEGQIDENPEDPMLVTHAHVYGPYNLAPGEKAKVVLTFVAGSAATVLGVDEMTYSRSPGAQDKIALGEQAMFDHYKKAMFAYENGYDLPDPPPDVAFELDITDNGQVRVTWGDEADEAADPDYQGDEANDIVAYRVYHSQPSSYNWHIGPWELMAEIPVKDSDYYDNMSGTYTFDDPKTIPGMNYYISVRAVDSGHDNWTDINGVDLGPIPQLEGGYAAPEQRNMIAVTPFLQAKPEYDSMSAKIRVVPNPFRLSDTDWDHRYPDAAEPLKIRFINLPRHCMIRIFSVSGDLVYEAEHFSLDSPEFSWKQDATQVTGKLVSGYYFWVVESLMSESKGKIQKGTLAIVK
nr:fibronectin type III domain-containing protein [candidate division KSB1 bacterium]